MNGEPPEIAEARERAGHARDRLFATFDELLGAFKQLQQRLEPSHLARDAWEAAKSKGADIAEDAVDAVARRPVATTGVIAAIALFLAREPLMDLATKLVAGKPKPKLKPKPKPKPKAGPGKTSRPRRPAAKKDETEIAA